MNIIILMIQICWNKKIENQCRHMKKIFFGNKLSLALIFDYSQHV